MFGCKTNSYFYFQYTEKLYTTLYVEFKEKHRVLVFKVLCFLRVSLVQ